MSAAASQKGSKGRPQAPRPAYPGKSCDVAPGRPGGGRASSCVKSDECWPGAASTADRDSPSGLGGQHGGSWRSTHCAITIEAQLPSVWVLQILIARQQEADFMIKAACSCRMVGK